jgi:hypothetical protein
MDGIVATFSRWLPIDETTVLFFLTTQQWWTTAVPLLICVVGVNLFFRHIVNVTWFTIKLLISIMVYTHVKELVSSSIGTDPMGIEQALFGVTAICARSTRIGHMIIKSHALIAVRTICPKCFALPDVLEEPEELHETPINEDDTSWMSWARTT